MEMAGSFPIPHHTVEQTTTESPAKPNFQGTRRPMQQSRGTPLKDQLQLGGDWAERLQRTISPRKQDRAALREVQGNVVTDKAEKGDAKVMLATTGTEKGFTTSIDLMNSLFRQPGGQGVRRKKQDTTVKEFEV
jgi:nuclear pore complex protein Nup98-Nup96